MGFEDWGDESRFNWKALLIALLLISAIIGGGYAVYKIVSPDSDPVNVSTPATLSKPTVNATSAVVGNTIQITVKLSDSLDGVQVFFYENDINIGSAYTGSGGTAIFNRVVSAPGTYVYHADCIHP
jgi:hypothetical protein